MPVLTGRLIAIPKDAATNALSGRPTVWKSSNNLVATVDGEGNVTARGIGTCNVWAEVEGIVSNLTAVTVVAAVQNIISAAPNPFSIPSSGSYSLVVTVRDSANNPLSGRVVTAVSNDVSRATIGSIANTDVNGQTTIPVTGVSVGAVIVTVTSEGINAGFNGNVASAALIGLWLEEGSQNFVKQNTGATGLSDVGGSGLANTTTGLTLGASSYLNKMLATAAGDPTVGYSGPAAGEMAVADISLSVIWDSRSTGVMYLTLWSLAGAGVVRQRISITPNGVGVAPTIAAMTNAGNFGAYPIPSLSGCYRVWTGDPSTIFNNGENHRVEVRQQAGTAGVSTIYWALPQVEQKKYPSSPIPNTTTSVISRARDDFTSAQLTGLWAASAGTSVEDSIWTNRVAENPYHPMVALGSVSPSGNDTQVGTRNTGPITSQCLNVVSTDTAAGAYAAIMGIRATKSVRLGGGTQSGHAGGFTTGPSTNSAANADATLQYIRSQMTTGQMNGLLFRYATYNTDLGASTLAGIDSGGFVLPTTNRTKLYDFGSGSLPAGLTFTRSTTAVNGDLSLAAVNTPRFVAGVI